MKFLSLKAVDVVLLTDGADVAIGALTFGDVATLPDAMDRPVTWIYAYLHERIARYGDRVVQELHPEVD